MYLVVILLYGPLDFRVFRPCYIVFQVPGYEECRICDDVGAYADVALANVLDGHGDRLCHFNAHHHYSEPASGLELLPAECRHGDFLALGNVFSCYEAHFKELLEHCVRLFLAIRVFGIQ